MYYFWSMKLRLAAIYTLIAGSLFFSSCENDIELNAPYQEIGVIYGLINPADSVHYVRIQKAFLGEGNALVMAQQTDSIYYPDILDVQLIRIKNGTALDSFPLTRFIGDDKDYGVFPAGPNVLYKTNGETIFRDSEYKLKVKNTVSGKVFSATTPIVDSMRIQRPAINSIATIGWASQFPYKVEFATANNGKVYNLTIRFRYIEEIVANGTLTPKYIDWVFPNILVSNPQAITSIEKEINGEDFYKFVASKLKVDNSVVRYAGSMDFIFTAGEAFLANYISINQATTSVLTSIPEYTNVEGGTGIFSSRFILISPNKNMDAPSLNLLKTGPYTGNLGFQ